MPKIVPSHTVHPNGCFYSFPNIKLDVFHDGIKVDSSLFVDFRKIAAWDDLSSYKVVPHLP